VQKCAVVSQAGVPKQFAEKLDSAPSEAKVHTEKKVLTAALKALRQQGTGRERRLCFIEGKT
jgi:hypothetical protein